MTNTKIEYVDKVWNMFSGCTKVSPGCDNCWALRFSWRMAHNPNQKIREKYLGVCVPSKGYLQDSFGKPRKLRPSWSGQIRYHPECIDDPFHWRASQRIFPASMSDLFHPDIPHWQRYSVFRVMEELKRHTFVIVTKRPDVALDFFRQWEDTGFDEDRLFSWAAPTRLSNIVFTTTVENQQVAGDRLKALALIAVPTIGIHYEPALGPLNLYGQKHVHLIIAGGETGPGARPSHPDWFRAARDYCEPRGISFWFKGWGNWIPAIPNAIPHPARIALVHRLMGWTATNEHYHLTDLLLLAARDPDLALMRWTSQPERDADLDGQTWKQFPDPGGSRP